MTARVAWISLAPVKGLALLQRDEVVLEPDGPRDDRRFILIGDDGRLLNGKKLAPLVQVVPDWVEESGFLSLAFPDGSTAAGIVELGDQVETNFYGSRDVPGRVTVGPWSEALSEFVGTSVRVVQVEAFTGRDRSSAPVSLLSTASLDALGEAAGCTEPVDARRFRMLFGVDGIGAHEEDGWIGRRVRVGEAEVEVGGNIGRCIVTSRDAETGVRNLPTLDVIAEYRHDVETSEPLPFGVWASVTVPGTVRLGAEIAPA